MAGLQRSLSCLPFMFAVSTAHPSTQASDLEAEGYSNLASRFSLGGTFYPGWGFRTLSAKGLGYPPIPLEGYPTYAMAASTSAYFLGNDTGLNSPEELAAEAKFGIVGVGWQIGMRNAGWQHLEQLEAETARQIKAINPKAKILVSRNSEVATVVWDSVRPLFDTPEHARASGLWVEGQAGGGGCAVGQVCNATWDCPNCGPHSRAIPYGKLFFNWTSQALQDWWLQTHIVAGVQRDSIDGVYFDCSCGAPRGIAPAHMRTFMAAAQAGFLRHVPAMAASKKMTIAWNGERVSAKSCHQDMARLSSIYTADENQTFQLLYNNNARDFHQTLAAFLILRGRFALLQYAVIGPYECAYRPCGTPASPKGGFGPYKWWPELDSDYGEPAGPPVSTQDGLWSREWSKTTVTLDCKSWNATITPKFPEKTDDDDDVIVV